MSPFPVVIHHNPDCGTSRTVRGIVHAAGYEPTVIEHLKDGWTRHPILVNRPVVCTRRASASASRPKPSSTCSTVSLPARSPGRTAK